jgi:uncharacterized protein
MSSNQYRIDLIGQGAECDANYIRLMKLIPRLRNFHDTAEVQGKVAEFCVANHQNDYHKVTVEISVIEAFKYTTTLKIVQKLDARKWFSNPILHVRVYHDASTAEVVAYQNHKNFQPKYPQPNPQMYQRDEKSQLNKFLGEWLSHCLSAGRSLKIPLTILSA